MTLRAQQRSFYSALVSPGRARARVDSVFAGEPSFTAAQRVAIYAEQYFWRHRAALAGDFPKLEGLIGAARFNAVTAAYLRAHPPRTPSISDFGAKLPEFIARAPPVRMRGDAGDLARLEWARSAAFLAPDSPVAPREALLRLGAGGISSARLELSASVHVLDLDFDVLSVWRRLEEGSAAPGPSRRRLAAVVWRRGFRVFHAPVARAEALALRRAARGLPLRRVLSSWGDSPAGAPPAFAALSSWFTEQMVARVVEDAS